MIELLHIDCMEYMKGVPDNHFDIAITDPQYNLGRKYNGVVDDSRSQIAYEEWCRLWFSELNRIVKRTIVFSCGSHNIAMWHRIKEPLWIWIWFKGNNMGSGSRFTNIGLYEPFLIYKNCKRLGVDGKYMPIIPQADAGFHDCPKPLKLIKHIVGQFSEPGDKIIDPFFGSGTMALACHDMKFDLVGCEIDENYYRKAVKRFENHKKQLQLW